MEIAYFWVEQYKKLNNFQANFSCSSSVKFENNKLTINENQSIINNFFRLDTSTNIELSISAIVGENGVGKSSILDFLQLHMENMALGNDYFYNFIVVFETDDELLFNSNIKFNIDNNTNKKIRILIEEDEIEKYLLYHHTIFFSNVFDVRFFDNSHKELHSLHTSNISTNSLLSFFETPDRFLNSEFKKQIFLVHEYKQKLKINDLINIPEKIYLEVSDFTNELDLLSFEVANFIEAFDGENIGNMYFNISSNKARLDTLLLGVVQRFSIDVSFLLQQYGFSDELLIAAFNKGHNEETIIDIILNKLIGYFKKLKNNEIANELEIFKKNYNKLLLTLKNISLKEDEKGLFILTDSKNTERFLQSYKDSFYSKNFLHFYWSELSSGQYSLLNLFGRFYDVLIQIEYDMNFIFESKPMKNLMSYLLLIDEGDLYFHPQWQKDWLYHFIKLLELIFEGRVQIILTTHSPLVLSDFPNGNVVFLTDDNAHLESDLDGSARTFGANINDLLTNSFFINDGLIGKFAKTKINVFTKQLLESSPDSIYRDKEYYKEFIDLIGEPLIKNKLLQIYTEKIKLSSSDYIENRINKLETEILSLKSRLK